VAATINHEIGHVELRDQRLPRNKEEARVRKIVDTRFFEKVFGKEWLRTTVAALNKKVSAVEKNGQLYQGHTPEAVETLYQQLRREGVIIEKTPRHDRILAIVVFMLTNSEENLLAALDADDLSLSTALAADTAQEEAHRPSATPSRAGTVYGPPASDDPQIAGSQAVQKGDYTAARKYFRLALERAEMDPEPGSELVASLRNLGEVLHLTGEYVEAEKFFDRAIEILRITRTADKRLLPVLLINQGKLYAETGRYVLSESLLKEALRLTEFHFGSQHMHMVRALNSLGILYMSTNKRGQAETHFKKAIGLAEKLSAGEDAAIIAPLLGNLAALYEKQDHWNRAALLLVRALEMAERGYDSDNLETATILHNLGVARYRQGKLDEAEKMLRRALRIRQKVFGPTNIFVAPASFTLAVILTDKGNYDEAKLRYTEALQVQQERLGLKAPEVATTLEHLAFVLRKMKNPQEASVMATRAKLIRAETDYSVKIEVGTGRR
jgi:tetratricopeptide (TPR) repeat protein